MANLVSNDGRIRFGEYPQEITNVNYMDYALERPMGGIIPGPLKKFRYNQFVFIGVSGKDLMAGLAIVQFKGLCNGFLYVFDRKANTLHQTNRFGIGLNASLGSNPSHPAGRFCVPGLKIEMSEKSFFAHGKRMSIGGKFETTDCDPLRLCTRAGYRGWVYTEKTSPINLVGEIEINGKVTDISSPGHRALMDWSAGFMRHNTYWNWAAIAGTLTDGRSIGLNLASGVNETGYTENAFWIDGVMSRSDMVDFRYDPAVLLKPWEIVSHDKKVNLIFTPENMREEKTNAILLGARFTQLVGTFSGSLVTDQGERVEFANVPGWVEDHFARW